MKIRIIPVIITAPAARSSRSKRANYPLWSGYTLLIGLIMLTWTDKVCAQMTNNNKPGRGTRLPIAPDTNKINSLIKTGRNYLKEEARSKKNIDSALILFSQALAITDSLNNANKYYEVLNWLALGYMNAKDTVTGKAHMMRLISLARKNGDKPSEARAWVRLGRLVDLPNEKLKYYQQAAFIYRTAGDTTRAIELLESILNAHMRIGQLELAKREALQLLAHYQAIKSKNIQHTFDLLSLINASLGNRNLELFYALQSLKSARDTRDSNLIAGLESHVASIYARSGAYEQSISYLKKTQSFIEKHNPTAYYDNLTAIIDNLIALKKPQQGLTMLESALKKHPPSDKLQRCNVYAVFARCYLGLKQYDIAEKYYFKQLGMVTAGLYDDKKDNDQVIASTYLEIGNMYVESKQFANAKTYLEKFSDLNNLKLFPRTMSAFSLLKFKIDSATGNYLSAIHELKLHKTANDSLYDLQKSKQAEELRINYETVQKESSIMALRGQRQLHLKEFQKAKIQRNFTLGSVIVLLLTCGLIYFNFRQKQRLNLALQSKDEEINAQNRSLQLLDNKQQILLKEKEGLFREIHQRVKHNLQTTLSLLNLQSSYLSNEDALEALRNSQRRMQTMALIHQKLYETENMTLINMPVYIGELVASLKDSFDDLDAISFDVTVPALELDVAQAVPLGLIINEAITNSIKYAFPGKEGKGRIRIALEEAANAAVQLTIADNGVGIPESVETAFPNSLGMNLMHGLTAQLQGDLTIQRDRGTTIIVRFCGGQHMMEEEWGFAEQDLV